MDHGGKTKECETNRLNCCSRGADMGLKLLVGKDYISLERRGRCGVRKYGLVILFGVKRRVYMNFILLFWILHFDFDFDFVPRSFLLQLEEYAKSYKPLHNASQITLRQSPETSARKPTRRSLRPDAC